MRKIALVVLIGVGLTLFAQTPSMAADRTADGFFGLKKFIKKAAPAGAAKKDLKKGPANAELTEDEKKLVKEMAAKVPARILSAPPPKVPRVVAQNAPSAPPRDPNAVLIRLPKPPGRVPQAPVTSGPEKPPSAPNKN